MSVNGMGGSLGIALQYNKYRDGITEPFRAKGNVVFSETPDDGDSLTIGSQTFTFKTTPAAAGHVKIVAGDRRATAINLVRAINNVGTRGTDYYTTTVPCESASAEISGLMDTVYITAAAYGDNTIVFTKSDADNSYTLSPATGTLTGAIKGGVARAAFTHLAFLVNPSDSDTVQLGTVTYTFKTTLTPTANEVQIGATVAATVAHLVATINGTGAAGTDYATGTTSPDVTVSAAYDILSGLTLVISARTAGVAGNSLASVLGGTGVSGRIAVSGATFFGGFDQKVFDRSTLTWKNFRATDVDYGVQQSQDVFPLEIGGQLTPTGAYKGLVFSGGGMTFLPRFLDDLGYLLLAAFGKCTTVNGGSYGTHTFTFDDNPSNLPWFATRKMIPGRGNIPYQGVISFDNIVAALRLSYAPASPLEAKLDMIGCRPELDSHPEAWTTTTEDYRSVGTACKGAFKLPAVFADRTVPCVGAIVELNNNTTGPREETIIGSYYLDDLLTRQRAMTIRWTHKWDSPNMYQAAFGGIGSNDWSPAPFMTSKSGSDYAFELDIQAPFLIPNTVIPYGLKIRANQAWWQPVSDVRLRPGNIITQEWQATVLYDPTVYVEAILTNGTTTNYAIPSEP